MPNISGEVNESQTPSVQTSNSTNTSNSSQSSTGVSEEEFNQWFDNMLNDIHHSHHDINDRIVGESSNRLKFYRQLDESKDNQKNADEMENALTSEDVVFAKCVLRPNRHIALLNQQDIEGTIHMWQLRHNRGPIHMHVKLKGFKVANHVHSHSQQHANHNPNHSTRRKRESNLIPVEVEPEDTTGSPIGASHSHGFHVHESGNLSRDCQSVGNHYNPLNLAHGGPYDVIRHVGDLGNIRCDRNGEMDLELVYSQVSLSGEHSIINRSLVIHNKPDDYGRNPNNPSSATTGSSGVRIACCLVEEVNELPKEEDSKSGVGSVAASKTRRETSRKVINKLKHEE
ncbi:unnamed protein product [Medioppia subpectinata]|uniref:Superoxide dismutase copper/zinc binding domain-containing protein n=1 Tax=Medioppia subpectinata TaxID=1979941 RepID=A0A7R9KXA0_9ACAR|nr:unnamed protein product [Medioppia subpectinata]CAG2110444.1 unnamed protein product [Medioppia subpectinata]